MRWGKKYGIDLVAGGVIRGEFNPRIVEVLACEYESSLN